MNLQLSLSAALRSKDGYPSHTAQAGMGDQALCRAAPDSSPHTAQAWMDGRRATLYDAMISCLKQALRRKDCGGDMSALEMLQTAEFVVDAQGNKKAALLDYKVWEELLTLLEDREDAEEIRRLRQAGEEALSWEQAKAELHEK